MISGFVKYFGLNACIVYCAVMFRNDLKPLPSTLS